MNQIRFYRRIMQYISATSLLFLLLPLSLVSQEIAWEEVRTGLEAPSVTSITADKNKGLYAHTGAGIYYSSDYGGSWERIIDSAVTFFTVISPTTFVGERMGMWSRTTDRGQTWKPITLPADVEKDYEVLEVAVNPAGNLYMVGRHNYVFRYTYTFHESTNLGQSWKNLKPVICNPDSAEHIGGLVIAPDGRFFIGVDFCCSRAGLYTSSDNGKTWQRRSAEYGYQNYIDKSGNIWYTRFTGLFGSTYTVGYSPDAGMTWKQRLNLPFVFNTADIFHSKYLMLHPPKNIEAAYIPAKSIHISTSTGFGCTSVSVPQIAVIPNLTNIGNLYVLCMYRDSAGYIYAGTEGGLYRSSNDGVSWELQSNGMIYGANVYDVLVEPHSNEIYVATAGGIFRSTDNLHSWKRLNNGLTNTYSTSIARANNGWLLAGNMQGLYYSTDNGTNWKLSNLSKDFSVTSIVRTPQGNLFAACDQHQPAMSTDNGQTWKILGTESLISRFAYNSALDGVFGVAEDENIMLLSPQDGSTKENWSTKNPHQAYDVACDSLNKTFFSAKSGMYVSIGHADGNISFITAGDISRFAFTATNDLLAGTLSGDVWMQNGSGAALQSKGLAHFPIRALAVLPDQRAIVGTDRGLFISKTPVVIARTPDLQQPVNGSRPFIAGIKPTWSSVQKIAYYHLQVARDSLFTAFIMNDSTLITASASLPLLERGTTYYWRVRTILAAQRSDWTPVWTFTTLPDVPKMPQLQLPANNTSVNGTSALLQWKAGQYAERYRLQVSNVPNFATILVEDSTLTTESYELQNLGQDTKYYWRVHSINLTGSSGWTTPWSFVANPNIGVEEPQTGGIQVYPNPANEEIVVQFPASIIGKTEITIVSSIGETLRHIPVHTPVSELKIGVKDLASGRYSLRILSGSTEQIVPIIIQR